MEMVAIGIVFRLFYLPLLHRAVVYCGIPLALEDPGP
uniref:Uncharacterized protein n=1 Tax=Arundo donax TaxID=35708 RepID=A0A0A9A8U0_ARUDO